MAIYERMKKPVQEWECPKCHKVVAKELLREEQPNELESFLSKRCKKNHEHKRRKEIRNRRTYHKQTK
jgi:hypothetical protein